MIDRGIIELLHCITICATAVAIVWIIWGHC